MIKKILWTLLLLSVLLMILYRDLISYGTSQLMGQLEIIYNTRPISEILKDNNVADSLKQRLLLVVDIKAYAVNKIGLLPNDNYTTFYDQKGEVALWNLLACPPYSLNPVKWSFPFLGSFPYKGFFNLEKAKKEMKNFQEKGFDVRIRPVSGWSTLGWTKDPILSSMLQRSEGSLAELIIHELTHGTIFVKGNVVFNENLASFVGEQGAKEFLISRYGKESLQLKNYVRAKEDSWNFQQHMLKGAVSLDSLYKIMQPDLADSIKNKMKMAMIDEIVQKIDTIHFYNQYYYELYAENKPNNTLFVSYRTYHSSKDSLLNIFNSEAKMDLANFVTLMKNTHID